MAKNQGLLRLTSGVSRPLQKSEIERGYIFVTKDTAFMNSCGGELSVSIDNVPIGKRRLDEHGRLFPRMSYATTLRQSTQIFLQYRPHSIQLDIELS